MIMGLEGYVGAKKQVADLGKGVRDLLDPEEKRRREDLEKDKSQSAARERAVVEAEERKRKGQRLSVRLKRRLGIDEETTVRHGENATATSAAASSDAK